MLLAATRATMKSEFGQFNISDEIHTTTKVLILNNFIVILVIRPLKSTIKYFFRRWKQQCFKFLRTAESCKYHAILKYKIMIMYSILYDIKIININK